MSKMYWLETCASKREFFLPVLMGGANVKGKKSSTRTFVDFGNLKPLSINYNNAFVQGSSFSMDVFSIILGFSVEAFGSIRFTANSGAPEQIKLIVTKNLAATCKQYHRYLLGWFDPQKIVEALQKNNFVHDDGKWNPVLDGFKTRKIFIFQAHQNNSLLLNNISLSLRPLLLYFQPPGNVNPGFQSLNTYLDELCYNLSPDEVSKKYLAYSYSNLILKEADKKYLESNNFAHAYRVSFSLVGSGFRSCVVNVRFSASLDQRAESSSEVLLTFKASFRENLEGVVSVTFDSLEAVPKDTSIEDFIVKKWNLQNFEVRCPVVERRRYNYY